MLMKFTKMHGLGNDFVVVDAINQRIAISPKKIRFMANRHTGIGFDQMLVVEQTSQPNVDFKYRIFNADGTEVGLRGTPWPLDSHGCRSHGRGAKRGAPQAT